MTAERDFAIQLATLAEAFGEQKLTPVRIEAYHVGLNDVPLPLLCSTVERLIQTTGSDSFRWTALPLVADIRKVAETIRREALIANPYDGCGACENQKGWVEVADDHGVMRAQRCDCWFRYHQKLERLGLTAKPIALIEAPREDLEPMKPVDPTLDMLPAPLQVKAREALRGKVLR